MTVTEQRGLATIDAEYSVVKPLTTADEALVNFRNYQSLTAALLQESDFQTFVNDQGKPARFIKKRGLRKLAVHYGFSIELIDERLGHRHDPATCARIRHPEVFKSERDCGCTITFARYVVKVTAPNGRVVIQPGLCSTSERRKFTRVDHDVATTAYTRAVSRAIADMIGISEPSAEEARESAEVSGLSLEDKAEIRRAWAAAPQDRRDGALAFLRQARFGGTSVAALFSDFNARADGGQVRELLGTLGGEEVTFDPDDVVPEP